MRNCMREMVATIEPFDQSLAQAEAGFAIGHKPLTLVVLLARAGENTPQRYPDDFALMNLTWREE
jgi:hypothetical protein